MVRWRIRWGTILINFYTCRFFGVGTRKPYEEALNSLLLGGGPSLDYIKSQPGFMLGSEMGQEGLERKFASTGVGLMVMKT